ncbi:MAG: bifunctional hydroxymethylpyrimidine kinase/phosphomethylpyrimidine kinase [Halofilum sp. (in: g-proteobacteria)]|nr:bifunctional hydroxymethylpyrimidine kinase/phosphomethylpyrimidine kinase [Halofilum sp. (in: g-proteobacteria)]
MTTVHALSIAGSDPSGGAGIQADLKTFCALGAYGMTALTALTVQNTCGVRDVHPVPPEFVAGQIDAVFEDVRVDAVKIGMLGRAETIEAVAGRLAQWRPATVVLDPVMVSKSGHRLLDEAAVASLRDRLVPTATVITPNLPEAGVLLDAAPPASLQAMYGFAERLHGLGAAAVLLKGGHLDDAEACDVLYDGESFQVLRAPRVVTRNTHGTGCTLSSAIAALAPRAASLAQAAGGAKRYLTAALQGADRLGVGHGQGPVNHGEALPRPDPVTAVLLDDHGA